MTPCAPNFSSKKTKLNMRNELLTRGECEAMRGLAIIGIFLHNYCHWLNPVVKENEYQFFSANVRDFLRAIAHPDALLPLQQQLSARSGPLLLVQGLTTEEIRSGERYRQERLLREISISTNTTAAGGNASLMMVG